MIEQHENDYAIAMMCRALEVSRAGYHAYRTRPTSERELENRLLLQQIRAMQKATRQSYGSPRMTRKLRALGKTCGRHRVARLMRENDLGARRKKRFRKTTDSNHSFPCAENLVAREFTVSAPNRVWVSDVTFIPTRERWLYLAVTLDLYSRKVVGWGMGTENDTDLVLRALGMAVTNRRPGAGLIFHSDRGSTYAADRFQRGTQAARHAGEHEPEGRLLGQRRGGELLLVVQDRVDAGRRIRDGLGGNGRRVPLHRDLLQSGASSLVPRLRQSGRLRGGLMSKLCVHYFGATPRLEVIDTTDPTAPVIVGSAECPGAYRVTVTGSRAYVGAGGGYGMSVIDVSNPRDPAIMGVYLTSTVTGLAVAGELAYIAASSLQVVDISNPGSPPLDGEVDTPGLARGVAVAGNIACIADGESGIEVIDVSNPALPQAVGYASTPGQAIAVAMSDGYLYAAWSGRSTADPPGGLTVFDLADPHAPIAMGRIAVDGPAMDVVVSGPFAYLVDRPGLGRLSVVDIRDPRHPVIVGSVQTTGVATGVAVEGDLVCVSGCPCETLLEAINYRIGPLIATAVDSPDWMGPEMIDGSWREAA